MERLDEARVRGELGRYTDALQVRVLSQVDSTNARLKEGARTGAIHPPFLLAADYQTAGRGRLGRTFVSPPGTGLYMSLLASLPENTPPGRITILSAVAVCRALEELTSLRPAVKWVNDIFVRGRKVCGILAEGVGQAVIIGIGVNVSTPPGGFPPEAGVAGALNVPLDRSLLAGRITRFLMDGLGDPLSPELLSQYRQRMPLMGREVCYMLGGRQEKGRVTGIAEDGGLMVEGADGPRTLESGEVTLGSYSFLGLE